MSQVQWIGLSHIGPASLIDERDLPHELRHGSSPLAASTLTQRVRSEIATRARRNRLFKSTLFSDPAWDILLELFAAEQEGQRLSVSSVGLAANVPATTAVRWLNVLEKERLVTRSPDPLDARRVFVSLSEDGLRTLTVYFEERR